VTTPSGSAPSGAGPTPTGAGPTATRRTVAARLPDFPWDRLVPSRRRAAEHPDGPVDLSVGTPVDPTPAVVREALVSAADSPGYPMAIGTPELRAAAAGWLGRRCGVTVDAGQILPAIGTKELISSLPMLLGLGPGDTVVVPELAYPTYEVGARTVGADVVATDSTLALGPARPALVWLNSPSNPTGRVLPAEHLAKVVAWAREHGALVVSDECYIENVWEGPRAASILNPDVCGGDHTGLLAVHSLSKRSNLAGYRCGFLAGDPAVVDDLRQARRHLGQMLPGPIQAAARAAWDDDAHADEQLARYARRRVRLRDGLEEAGFRIDHSQGALYLWATRDESCWDTVAWLAERGIVVAPGDFYGRSGGRHVRVAITATDERVDAAYARLAT
jgi:succinyldiaminopimelate transaminase